MNYGSNLKDVLKNYKDNLMRIKVGIADEELKKAMDFIGRFIAALDADDKEIINALYINRRNVSKLSKQGCYVRSVFYKKADKIIEKMQQFYTEML